MPDITVDTSEALKAAIKTAQAGDTIYLAPGNYGVVSVKGFMTEGGAVTLTSADPFNPAVLSGLTVTGSAGFIFSNLEFYNPKDGQFSYMVNSSRDITFSQVNVHGSLDNNPGNDPNGISIQKSANVRVIDSEFQQLGKAITVGDSQNIEVARNDFHDLQTDGVTMSDVQGAKVVGNEFKNFFPDEGDHPDAIQFWTSGTSQRSEDIVITDNVILRGTGSSIQGIFMRDEIGNLPYKNVTIADNFLAGTGYHGITISHVEGVTVTGNELISYAGEKTINWILVKKADGAVVTDNSAVHISFDTVTGLVDQGNVINKAVADQGLAAIQLWRTASLDGGDIWTPPTIPTTYTPPVTDLWNGGGFEFDLSQIGAGGWYVY